MYGKLLIKNGEGLVMGLNQLYLEQAKNLAGSWLSVQVPWESGLGAHELSLSTKLS